MKRCAKCGGNYTEVHCPRCVSPTKTEPSSNLDQLIQDASVPSLATLFRKAKEAGAIGPVSVYGEGSTS